MKRGMVFPQSCGILLLLLLAQASTAQYAGSKACQACHPDKFESQSKTGHARALALAPSGSLGHWAFGAGAKATTYVSQADEESYIEHGLTYYASTKSMARTPGHSSDADLPYRTFDPLVTVLRCFRCHSTGPLSVGPGRSIEPFEPGVHCESCHGPGAAHVRSMGAAGTIRNPKQLKAAELNEYCGSCHRKPPEAGEENDWTNAWNIRHQPTYLSRAACFRKSNGALSCLTCHDPHTPLRQVAADYDKRCVSCHHSVRHRTAVASRACVDCHMPQAQTNPQLRFTNHWIGVYAKGSNLAPVRRVSQGMLPLRLLQPQSLPFAPPADAASLTPVFEKALADREKELGPNHPKVARSAADLGQFLKTIGDPAAAEAPLRRALEIDRANGGPALAADQENLASALEILGKQDEALALFQQAAKGPDASVAARCFATLAVLDESQAESYYRSALQAEEAASGKDHPRVAMLLSNLALVLKQKKDYQSAEPLFRRALAIQQKALGPKHPATASTLNNLGSLLQDTGQLDAAERLERQALAIFEERLGPESKEVATTCTNLADLLWSKGDRASAEKLYRRAISIDESIYGPDDPELAGDLANLGLLLKETNQPSAGEALLRRALAIYEKTLGPQSPQARDIREALQRSGH